MKNGNVIILVQVDESCDMARVSVNRKQYRGMEGNFWDFHPGCHDIREYGDFDSYAVLAQKIYIKLLDDGIPSSKIELHKEKYKFANP